MSLPHSKPVVLVVDDSPIDQTLAVAVLRKSKRWDVVVAGDGVQALDIISKARPSVVVTDMQMPHLNGLELVERIRRDFAAIPTVLMTAHGSEETAMEALRRGAASYVPKRFLADCLADCVTQVMSLTGTDEAQALLPNCWNSTKFEFVLNNDTMLIPALVNHLQRYVRRMRYCDETETVRVGVALHEAIRNAIHHGNLELDSALRRDGTDRYYKEADRRRQVDPYRQRRVSVTASESPTLSSYQIRDEGGGFDTDAVFFDPDNLADLAVGGGRGLFLIKTFMDEVHFNDRGNEITMIHRRKSAETDTSEASVSLSHDPVALRR